MPRKSMKLDDKLIRVGLDLLAREGVRALTVRRVCRQAHVNLGMFTYFFGDKETYLKHLFDVIRARLDTFLNMECTAQMNAWERLRYFLRRLMAFAAENVYVLRAIVTDCLMWDKTLWDSYCRQGIITPRRDLYRLIQEAQAAGYLTRTRTATDIHETFLFGLILPVLFPTLSDRLLGNPSGIWALETYYNKLDAMLDEMENKHEQV